MTCVGHRVTTMRIVSLAVLRNGASRRPGHVNEVSLHRYFALWLQSKPLPRIKKRTVGVSDDEETFCGGS